MSKGLGLDNDFILQLILFFPGFVQIFGSQNSNTKFKITNTIVYFFFQTQGYQIGEQ